MTVQREDTDELRRIAQEIHRIEHDPRRPGVLDFVLAVGASTALATAGVCLVILTVASDKYAVERGRVVLTLAAVAVLGALALGAVFGLNRANRKRFDAAMEKMERIRCACDGGVAVPEVTSLTREAYRLGRRQRPDES